MLTVLVFLFLLIVFDIAAMCWGFTSSDGPASKEWDRRWQHTWLKQYSEASSPKLGASERQLPQSEIRPLCM